MKYLVLFILLNGAVLFGSEFDKAKESIEVELKQANTELDRQRSEVFAERQVLLRRQSALKASRDGDLHKSSSLKEQLLNLKSEVQALSKELKAREKLMLDAQDKMLQMRRTFEPVLPLEYGDSFQSALAEQDAALKNKDYAQFLNLMFSLQLDLLRKGSEVNNREVSAVAADGQLKQMKLFSLGHAQFYLYNADQAGMLQIDESELHPELQAMPGLSTSLGLFEKGDLVDLPFDFTAGLAMKEEAQAKTFIEHFKAGGIIIYPLLFLGCLCLLTGLYKTTQLYTVRSRYDDKVQHLLSLIDNGDLEAAKAYVSSLKNPIRGLLTEALEQHRVSRENLEEHLNENILSQLPSLDRFLTVLSVSAGAAPLLGLLGTVMGIIKTFEMIGIYGTGDANRMAGGISEALVTTEMGLIVAIPALIWHAVLNRRLRTIVSNLEKAMLSFVNARALKGDQS